jgi:hypothetical protein
MFEKMFDLRNPYFVETIIMFLINLFFLFFLIRVIYYCYTKRESTLFALFLIGIIVFFIGSILNAINLDWAIAVGLVAVFTIMRLRTTQISIKDMAYVFAVIGISVINALRLVAFPLTGRIIINIIIVLTAFILEEFILRRKVEYHKIVYENIDLLKPERKKELLDDLSEITGQSIIRIKVDTVDYRKKSAELIIYYLDRSPEI